ncbi:tyrosine--tRNA ligase [Patescibacteria group bacterium]|nr:tyrosine--tRNA ligase [Patescibacteria group bacterium]
MRLFTRHPRVITDEKKVDELLTRGVTEVIVKDSLRKRLLSGERLRVKLGIDPTSPDLHIGRAVALWKLRAFQDLGHTAVFIVGDATGVVGDTSDKEAERPMLTQERVGKNMKTYFDQAFKILDPQKTETHYNSKWLDKLGFLELTKMASLFGLNEFASRELISKRMDAGQRVSFHELLYPLMQGYDSVAVRANVELGGTDQRFNLLAGRNIQKLYNQEPQDIMTLELLEGTDGRKMSSSWGNVVNVLDKPNDMYGKIMSVKDELVERYFTLCTRVPTEAIEEIMALHPKEAKMRLAKEIVTLYHGKDAAEKAAAGFMKPDDAEEVVVPHGTKLRDTAGTLGLSIGELRRLVAAGAVEVAGGEKVASIEAELTSATLKIGKHRFVRIKVRP